jgi:PAS domain-containing protein
MREGASRALNAISKRQGSGVAESDFAAAIIQGLDEPTILLDETETITHLNEAAAAILGIERDQIVGRAFDDDLGDHRLGCAPIRAAFEKAGSLPQGQQQSELSLNPPSLSRKHTASKAQYSRFWYVRRGRDPARLACSALLPEYPDHDQNNRETEEGGYPASKATSSVSQKRA